MELILRTINVDCAQSHFQEMPFTHYFMKENVKVTNYFTKKKLQPADVVNDYWEVKKLCQ